VDGQAPLSGQRLVVLNVLWFGLSFQSAALLPVVVPTQILLIVARGTVGGAEQATYLGWLSAAASLVALVVQPLVGSLSDRTRSPWGRRRPHVMWGTAVAIAGAAALTAAGTPLAFALTFLVLQAGSNAATAAYQGLLPDLVPRAQRGTASGYLGLMTILGNAGSLGLAAVLLGSATVARPAGIASGARAFYVATILVLAATCAVNVLGVSERPAPPLDPGAPRAAWRSRSYRWVFVARFLVIMGLTLFLTFIEYYFAQVAHVSDFVGATAVVALVALLVAVVSAVALGLVSDRTRRVPLAFGSTLVMALAAALFIVGHGAIPLWSLGATFGLGYGAYWSVDWALAVDSLPQRRAAGRDLGVWSLASTLPSAAAPALGGAIVGAAAAMGRTAAGYQAVFVAAGACFLLGAVAVLGVSEEAAERAAPARSDPRPP
jgi:MFS family permease